MIEVPPDAQLAVNLGIAAAVALVAWLGVLGVLALWSRPRLPDAGPATSELPGTESPAVVNLLVNRWEVGHEAVPATLLDLAARKAVDVDRVSPERYALRLRRSPPSDLTDYERQVLDHVRGLAVAGLRDPNAVAGLRGPNAVAGLRGPNAVAGLRGPNAVEGTVPCEALTTGPEEQSKGWWRRFEKAVVADARRQGLTRPRWGAAALVALGIVAVAPALLAGSAFSAIPESETSTSDTDDAVTSAIVLGAVTWMALMALPYKLRAERDTPKGRETAARWLGVQEYLDASESFDRAPPTAVAIWDRYLAYGAAMGVAAGAVRALPLGSESDREAWSGYGGHWHHLRIRYPSRIPPGWGHKPWVVALKATALLGGAALVAFTLGSALTGAIDDFYDTARQNDWQGASTIGSVVLVVLAVVLTAVLARAAIMLCLAIGDFVAKDTVEGLIVRLRDGYVAVDDGRSLRVRAWKVEPAKLWKVGRGMVVRATVSRYLGYVFAIEAVVERPKGVGLEDAPVDEVT